MATGYYITRDMMMQALIERFEFDEERLKILKQKKRFDGRHAEAILTYAEKVRLFLFDEVLYGTSYGRKKEGLCQRSAIATRAS